MNLASQKNKKLYYTLTGQFYTSKLCTKAFNNLKKNCQQNISIYRLGSILLSNIKKKFNDFLSSIKKIKPLKTILEESKDFSFMDYCNGEAINKFSKKILNVFLRHGFEKINNLLENLTTSRQISKENDNHSQQIIEKTENISERIFNIVNCITEKESIKKTKNIPKLKIDDIKNNKKGYIITNRCNELEKEIEEISNNQIIFKIIASWKRFTYIEKTKRYKINSVFTNRFLKVNKKCFYAIKKYSKKKLVKKTRVNLAK